MKNVDHLCVNKKMVNNNFHRQNLLFQTDSRFCIELGERDSSMDVEAAFTSKEDFHAQTTRHNTIGSKSV